MRKLTEEERKKELTTLYGHFEDDIYTTARGITNKEVLDTFKDAFKNLKHLKI